MVDATNSISTDAPGDAGTSVPAGAAPAASNPAHAAETVRPAPLPLRNDTILGVCEAIGQDFGFHPNFLRIALSLGLFVNALGVAVLYLGLGLVVAVTRWLYPARRAAAAEAAAAPEAKPVPSEAQALPLAA